jgi:Transposase
VFNVLEGSFEVLLVNAHHVKAVPGRKTDVTEAAWLAELLQHGLLRASVIPPVAQRELRDLTRYRSTFIRARVTLVNRVQKLLEDANIKLAAVASVLWGSLGGRYWRPCSPVTPIPRPSPTWRRDACAPSGTVGASVGRAGQTASSVGGDGAVVSNRQPR